MDVVVVVLVINAMFMRGIIGDVGIRSNLTKTGPITAR